MTKAAESTTPVEKSQDEIIKQLEIEAKQLELQIKKRQLESLELEQQEREYNIRDLKQRLAERDHKEKQLLEDRAAQGRAIAQQRTTDEYRFRICTHRKGGTVTPRDTRVLSTGGNKDQYAIVQHRMINGDLWIRCLRCGKTWAPPVEKNFFFNERGVAVAPQDGTFSREKFEDAKKKYLEATYFNTNNTPSASVQCRFEVVDAETGRIVDAADIYRNNIASTTLR